MRFLFKAIYGDSFNELSDMIINEWAEAIFNNVMLLFFKKLNLLRKYATLGAMGTSW